jgi:hypothetical protein
MIWSCTEYIIESIEDTTLLPLIWILLLPGQQETVCLSMCKNAVHWDSPGRINNFSHTRIHALYITDTTYICVYGLSYNLVVWSICAWQNKLLDVKVPVNDQHFYDNVLLVMLLQYGDVGRKYSRVPRHYCSTITGMSLCWWVLLPYCRWYRSVYENTKYGQ